MLLKILMLAGHFLNATSYSNLFHSVFLGGVGISRVADLAIFSPRVSGFTFKSFGLSGFEMCHGCGFGHFSCSGFRYFIPMAYFFGFSKS